METSSLLSIILRGNIDSLKVGYVMDLSLSAILMSSDQDLASIFIHYLAPTECACFYTAVCFNEKHVWKELGWQSAIEWSQTIEPNFVEAHFNLGLIYEQKSMFEEAISEFRKVVRISGGASFWSAALGHAYAMAGRTKRARKIRSQLQKLSSRPRGVSPFDMAWMCLGLGETDAAFEWMERAFQERCGPLVYQKIEPALDPLRPDPRFQDLLRRIGLSH